MDANKTNNSSKWVVVDRAGGGAPGVAKGRLLAAFERAGIKYDVRNSWTGAFTEDTIILAPNTDPIVYNIAEWVASAPESIQIFRHGKAVALSGSDARGLAYAIMETAERIEARGANALYEAEDEFISPSVAIRGIDKIVCNTDDCGWWMDEGYWRWRLGEMLAARYNRLTLLVGYDTSYLSPPYPYFVEVPEYPGVRVSDQDFDRAAHLAALRRLGRLAHEFGMDFTFATWQQTNWLASQKSKVEGIDDLMEYCSAGIRELALQCPEIDTIQLRVNHEAGVGTQVSDEEYWFRQIDGLAEAKKRGSNIKLEMRAKGLTDPMIRYAKDQGLDLMVSTKYWCEQAGLPHHLTRMRTEELTRLDNFNHSRRYSYSDMLKKPRLHKFLYRLWNDGSTDLFTWGDPDYVRRFVASLALGKADGFEIMPMLSLKGGPEDGKQTGWDIFRDPAYQPGGYEESRYWLSERLFGRIGYNADEGAEAWMRPMRRRYGNSAGAESLMAAIAAASKIIPFIVGYHMPVHPQLAYWAEFSTGGALFAEHNYNPSIKHAGVTYQSTEPGDAGLFYPIDEYARAYLANGEDGRYTPWQVVGVLGGIAANAMKYLGEAEAAVAGAAAAGAAVGSAAAAVVGEYANEWRGAVLDIKMIIELALYHRFKIAAAVNFCLYEETDEYGYLAESLGFMRKAKEKWVSFAELGQKYSEKLVFYVGNFNVCRVGNWKDFYPELDADIAKLEAMLGGEANTPRIFSSDAHRTHNEHDAHDTVGSIPAANIKSVGWQDDVPAECAAGEELTVTLVVNAIDAFRNGVNLRYRHTNQLEGKFVCLPMKLSGGVWRVTIPADYIVPEWDLLIYFEAAGMDGNGITHPGLWNQEIMLPYYIVEVK